MRRAPWWQYGLIGGAGLSLATLIKFIGAVIVGAARGADWGPAPGFAALIFAMGSLCGLVAWASQDLSRRFGPVGDALTGMAVMIVFFLCCMIVFAPEMLGPKFATAGAIMFGLAVVVGLILGVWIGHDLRKEIAARAGSDRDQSPG